MTYTRCERCDRHGIAQTRVRADLLEPTRLVKEPLIAGVYREKASEGIVQHGFEPCQDGKI
jgi:hypothetical protein